MWDQHFQLELVPLKGFFLTAKPEALTRVNGEPAQCVALRNGDMIQAGSASLQFWLAESRQRGLAWREWLTWVGIAAVCLGQVGLVYWLW